MKATLMGLAVMVGVCVGTAGRAEAASILSPTSVYNNTIGTFAATSVNYMIDQSGLSAGFTSGVTDFTSYISGNPTHDHIESTHGWAAFAGGGGFAGGDLDFDLGAVYSVNHFVLWNIADISTANVQSFTLFVSSDPGFVSSVNVGTFTNPQGNDLLPYPATVFDNADAIGQYLRLRINSLYGNPAVVEIGEVALDAAPVAPVPEASHVLLAAVGALALAGFARRRFFAAA